MSRRGLADLRLLHVIRFFEEAVHDLIARGVVRGTCHLCVGQEAVAVGAGTALAPGDLMVSTHRGHGHLLARGGDPRRMFAEIMGRKTGYCLGRGGTQHLCAMDRGFLGTNGITGGGLPLGTGAALGCQLDGSGRVVVAFLGDGAANQGTFHECLNMAALWRLPVIYLCENNLYAMSTPVARALAGGSVARRAAAYRSRGGPETELASAVVDGMDVAPVRRAVARAARRARAGRGPTLIEALTYRFHGHSKSDPRCYRSRAEEEQWRARDPLALQRRRLAAAGVPEARLEAEIEQARAAVAEALRLAAADEPGDAATARGGVYA